MSLVTLEFLEFLAIVLLVYFVVGRFRRQWQWTVLLVASYVFYGWVSPDFLIYLVFCTFITWSFSIGISECGLAMKVELLEKEKSLTREEKEKIRSRYEVKKKCWLGMAVVLNFGLLLLMKYGNSSLSTINSLFGTPFEYVEWWILPLGFSFYTFQSMGYVIDVYRGAVEPQHNFFKYALYVSFFPQISEGPIGNYGELFPQLMEGHAFRYDRLLKGLIRILVGFFKKIVVADTIGRFVSPVYDGYLQYSGAVLALATLLYAVQLYADFSGYIDIAIGSAQCLGIRMTENFETPYFSHSISEYWRRWHISLGSWFRTYLYYPVLRSKVVSALGRRISEKHGRKLATCVTTTIGLLATWFLIGMWHGKGLNFIAHGLYHGFFIILSVWLANFYKKAKTTLHIRSDSRGWKLFQMARTFLLVLIGYVLFRGQGFTNALTIYRKILFQFADPQWMDVAKTFLSTGEWTVLLAAMAILFGFDLVERKKRIHEWIYERKMLLRWLMLYVLLAFVLLYLLYRPADVSNFLYFEF